MEGLHVVPLVEATLLDVPGGSLGLAGALLAALGVYGLVAFSVTQRRREIGIRMALGADRRRVVALILLDTLRIAGWGLGLGWILALAAGQVVSSLLIGVSPFAPLPFALAGTLVVAFATLASLGPARRAATTDPVIALKA